MIARWLAQRIEIRRRRMRRALRDYQRNELRRISAADRRARGLRLYAAWACKEDMTVDCRTIVPLEASPDVGERHAQKIRIIRSITA
jgi:hypothetical protein